MVGDQHRLADPVIGPQAPGGIGQDDDVGAGGAGGAHRMNHQAQIVALIGVDAADEDQDPLARDHQGQHLSAMTVGAGREEAGKLGHRHLRRRRAQGGDRRSPA